MSKQFDKLIVLLKELFQLDQPDLDFGLYRIMHAKSDEITQFLERDLLPQVKKAFSHYTTADKAEIEKELAKVIAGIEAAGMDPSASPKVKELRQKLADESVDIAGLENEVYDNLYSFFRRYYHEGDFLSKRVYKPGVYAIPYEGEEVKLHWANQDQYYIKTSEYLRDYAFMLQPDNETDPMRVHFRLADAKEGEHGNVKATEGKERVFILQKEEFIAEEEGELVIAFEYRTATMDDWSEGGLESATAAAKKKPPAQKELLTDAARRVFSINDPALKRWIDALSKKHVKVNGETADHSRLEGHLNRYTKRHQFDYFIHKDLGGFLRRELDFYIKNEVMHLDDVENETVPRVEQYLSKIKVIRKVAHKLIAFLAQLEDFQKKLWLKKKFIVETNYCITLDRVPQEFYPEIAANEAQREEWVKLFAINEIEGDLTGKVAYSKPLTVKFLKANPYLVLDTQLFEEAFKTKIIASIENLDEQSDGLLIHSENFQALNLLRKRYWEQINCIYIDPPYNTSENTFLYKNAYKHSSWMSMISSGISLAYEYLLDSGVFLGAIDDTEYSNFKYLLNNKYGNHNYVGTVAVEVNPAGQNLRPNVPARSHDYFHIFAKDINSINLVLRELSQEERDEYSESDEKGSFYWDNLRRRGGNSRPNDRPKQWFPLYLKDDEIRVPEMKWEEAAREWRVNEKPNEQEEVVWPIDPKGEKRIWRVNPDGARREIKLGEIGVIEKAGRLEISKKSREPEGKKPKTLWSDSKYSATTHGSKLLLDILGPGLHFSYPKSIFLTTDAIRYWLDQSGVVLDYFAGSGTTGHAVMNLNREDGENRKYILVEMGSYFETALKPRIQKVIYSADWKKGKPDARDKGISHCFKYIRLESYDDTINNLKFSRDDAQRSFLETTGSKKGGGIKEQFILQYMLNVETQESQSLLNISAFKDPTAYQLKVKRPGSDESREVNVDLLETFNYLIGLTVQHMAAPQTFQAAFKRDGEGRLRLDGRLKQDDSGLWWFRTVTGKLPDGRNALIIWRKLTGDPEQDNLVLDEWFTRQGYSTKDYEFGLIYVNGDSNLENLRQPDETWKVRLIEEDFHRLMFEDI